MSFVPNFTVAQTPQNPSVIQFTDTSTGTISPSVTARRIYIQTSQNTYLVTSGVTTNYNLWPIASNQINLNVLTSDQAVTITVQWVDVYGNAVYSKAENYCLAEFNKQFFYYLVQMQSQHYNVIQDNFYWGNMGIYWTNIIGALNAVEIGNDIAGSQACLNRATNMKSNQNFYF